MVVDRLDNSEFSCSSMDSSFLTPGHGARSDVDKVFSFPLDNKIRKEDGLASTSKTWSLKGSSLLRTNRRSRTGQGESNQAGIEVPIIACRRKQKSLSCGISFVAKESKDRNLWSAAGNTSSQLFSGRDFS